MKRANSVAFSLNGHLLANGGPGSSIKLWDVWAKRELKTLSGQSFDIVSSVAFRLDGKMLASGYERHHPSLGHRERQGIGGFYRGGSLARNKARRRFIGNGQYIMKPQRSGPSH